jgi:hypothetical protein
MLFHSKKANNCLGGQLAEAGAAIGTPFIVWGILFWAMNRASFPTGSLVAQLLHWGRSTPDANSLVTFHMATMNLIFVFTSQFFCHHQFAPPLFFSPMKIEFDQFAPLLFFSPMKIEFEESSKTVSAVSGCCMINLTQYKWESSSRLLNLILTTLYLKRNEKLMTAFFNYLGQNLK